MLFLGEIGHHIRNPATWDLHFGEDSKMVMWRELKKKKKKVILVNYLLFYHPKVQIPEMSVKK